MLYAKLKKLLTPNQSNRINPFFAKHILQGHLTKVMKYISRHANSPWLNYVDQNGNSAAILAAKYKQYDMLHALLQQDVLKPNTYNNDKQNVIHFLVQATDTNDVARVTEILTMMLNHPKMTLNPQNNQDKKALIWAILNSKNELVRRMMTTYYMKADRNDFLLAVKTGNLPLVKFLLTQSISSIGTTDLYGLDALYHALAIPDCDLRILKTLLGDARFNVNHLYTVKYDSEPIEMSLIDLAAEIYDSHPNPISDLLLSHPKIDLVRHEGFVFPWASKTLNPRLFDRQQNMSVRNSSHKKILDENVETVIDMKTPTYRFYDQTKKEHKSKALSIGNFVRFQ